MRFIFFSCILIVLGCTQSAQETLSTKEDYSAVADSIIHTVSAKTAPNKEALNWNSLSQLMNSLGKIPAAQRNITLKTIKEESIELLNVPWPEEWNTNPIRSRYMVYLTHASIAADQRLNDSIVEGQARSIVKMKNSWNNFVLRLEATAEPSAVF
jgi:hypothetical protein